MDSSAKELFEQLLEYLQTFDGIEVIYLKTCIQFRINATFLSIYPKKGRLELEFQLNREDDQFPIYQCIRISRNRVLHKIAIEEPGEFDGQLKIWLLDAYNTIKKK